VDLVNARPASVAGASLVKAVKLALVSNTEIGYAWGCCDPPVDEQVTLPPL
jgi:hypothetical protein